jgi:putative ABC transport system permease protein
MLQQWAHLIDEFAQDVAHAGRQLVRSAGFAALAVLCLALGIGVNTSIFSVLHAVLFRPMPVSSPERLVVLSRGVDSMFSYPAYRDYRAASRMLIGLTATSPMEGDFDVDGASEFVALEATDSNYADVMGVRPVLGTWFGTEADSSIVISHSLWNRRFNLDRNVLGRRVLSSSQAYTIVGVLPAGFTGIFAPMHTDVWVPVRSNSAVAPVLEDRERRRFLLFGRLAPGATAATATAELETLDLGVVGGGNGKSQNPAPIVVAPVRGVPSPGNRRTMVSVATTLSIVVAVVLLIACVNVGHLLLARGAGRQSEIAIRGALGATRSRIARQLLTETLVLAVVGALCGIVFAYWTNEALELSLPALGPLSPQSPTLSLDWSVIAFAMALAVTTAVLCGLLPAWRGSRARAVSDLRSNIWSGLRPLRRPFGVVAQVGMSFVLLMVAGACVRHVLRIEAADPGFAVSGRLYAQVFIPTPPFTLESGRQFYSEALVRLRALPGVERAAMSYELPLAHARRDCAGLPSGSARRVTASTVGPDYFTAIGIPLIGGRDFAVTESDSAALPVVVNENLARALWLGAPVVGERLLLGCKEPRAAVVIGVVRDSAITGLGEPIQPHVYLPFWQGYRGGVTTILVEAGAEPSAMVNPVRRALREMGQGIRVYTVEPLREHVVRSYALFRWLTSVLVMFGLLALLLAATGLYAVTAYRVAVRKREIGLRMALGARRREIFGQVVGQGLLITLSGVLIGQVLSAALIRAVGAVIPGIVAPDLTTFVAAGTLWLLVAAAASYVPAGRAASVDPLVVLRDQ